MLVPYTIHFMRRLLAFGLCMLIAVPFSSGQHRITLEEAFRIGDAPDGLFFARIPKISVDSAGRIFIADGHAVNVVSSTGNEVGLIGTEGEGPGEFRRTSSIVNGPKDSVYVWDDELQRVTVFAPDDFRFVRTLRISSEELSYPLELLGVTSQGMAVRYHRSTELFDLEGAERSKSVFVLSLGDGKRHARPLVVLPDMERVNYPLSSGTLYGFPMPFGMRPVFEVGHDGLVYYGMSGSVDIRIKSLDFLDRGAIVWKHSPMPVTRSDREDFLKRTGEIPSLRKALESATLPRYKPAYDQLIVDDQARVWLKLSTAFGAQNATWVVLDQTSQEVGRFELPTGLNVEAVRGDRAYGTVAAENGAPLVIAYDITVSGR